MGLPVALALSSLLVADQAGALMHSDAIVTQTAVIRDGVASSVNARMHRFAFASSNIKYTVTYTPSTAWSVGLEKSLKSGWHVIVTGQLKAGTISATKIAFDRKPLIAACNSDAETVNVAVQAYLAINNGKAPPSVASLTAKANGGPYLQRVPGNRSFYRIALNWGGHPAKENGGKNPGYVDVAPVTTGGVVAKYISYDTQGAHQGCNAVF